MNMVIPAESPSEENNGGEQESLPSLTHHPPAPSDELFDISTTVDPGYVISLIRKLLPINVKDGDISEEQKSEELKTASVSASENCEGMSADDENKSLGVSNDFDEVEKFHRLDVGCCGSTEKGLAAGEEAWEEYGCILWDLAASKPHAEFMVQNLILEVLFSSLVVSKSARITEISLGIIGNLACHELSRKMITSTNGLTEAVLEQLFLDDIPCLCEACRVVTLCLQGDEKVLWAEAFRSEHLLSRILWIVENTLNVQLIHKSVGLLLAALQSKQVAIILQPPLMKLGLLRLLVDLLSFEMSKVREERLPERYSILDLVLQTIEALSVMDESSQEICADKELFVLLTDLIKLPEKIEVADSCVTAAVLIANILTDAADLTLEISQDLLFLQGLFRIFPFASADPEATSALWSIIARFLVQALKLEVSPLQLNQYVSVITSESEVIEEELLDDHSPEERGTTATFSRLVARNAALNSIVQILNQWMCLEDRIKESAAMGKYHVNEEDAHKLLRCCEQYIKRD